MDEEIKEALEETKEVTKEVMRIFLEDEEFFVLMAETLGKSHAALMKAGFSREEATNIVAHQAAAGVVRSH
ncbi:MAG: hypothetical protein Q8O83_02580 [bacterium]|nr:hypothetical protein [bacterium]MDZ4209969.1 hypothetical protein [Candidatus Curtissbacteria bacterium]